MTSQEEQSLRVDALTVVSTTSVATCTESEGCINNDDDSDVEGAYSPSSPMTPSRWNATTTASGADPDPSNHSVLTQCPRDSCDPITVLAKHCLREGAEDLFSQWLVDIIQAQSPYKGYLGSEVIRPLHCSHSREYISIFRYDTYENLKVWMSSNVRAEFVERAKEFSESPILITYHSLEHWFVRNSNVNTEDFSVGVASSPAASSSGGPPPKYKMVVVVFLVIWFQVHYIGPNTVGRIDVLPPLAKESLGTLLITTLTTYVFMPICTRLLAFWLFPGTNYLATLQELVPQSVLKIIRSLSCNSSNNANHQQTRIETPADFPDNNNKSLPQQVSFAKSQPSSLLTTKTSTSGGEGSD
jgi:antibiotic biosynthesis monooxygenase (ABM) superfamily enzyme